MMLDVPRPTTELVEAQAIGGWLDEIEKTGTQLRPLCWINLALENGKLDTNTKVLTRARNATQSPASLARNRADVVCDEDEHCITARQKVDSRRDRRGDAPPTAGPAHATVVQRAIVPP